MNLSEESDQIQFGDARSDARCKRLLRDMLASPDKSFPKMTDDWGALKACYRFLNNQKVSREKILAAPIQQTVKRCNERDAVLVVQDTTTLSYQHHLAASGLGHVGSVKCGLGYGMIVHNTCAFAADSHEPLGILHQEVIVRTVIHPREEEYRDRLSRARESHKWLNSARRVREILPRHSRLIHVADREADIYFFMKELLSAGQGFVIRQTRQRRTDDGSMETSCDNAKDRGTMRVAVPRNGTRKARTATVALRSGRVTMYSPKACRKDNPPITATIVIVTEVQPPDGTPPLFWVLLTSESAETLDACVTIVQHYQGRWAIEEFHKALKSGCSIEKRQLASRHGLENVLGISSIIAILLLYLKFQVRINQAQPVTSLTQIQRRILCQKFPSLPFEMTNQQALHHIARLGGFLGRKHDGHPGWIVMMRGYYDLLVMEQGFIIAMTLMGKG